MRWTALAALLALAFGCSRDLGPEASYRALARAVAERDADKAWALLSSGSQKRLDALAREAASRAPGVVPASGRQLLLGDASLTSPPIASLELVEASGDRALLKVSADGRPTREVQMVREGGRWRVELPAPEAAGGRGAR